MRREYRNYVMILICCTILILMFTFHLIQVMNDILMGYNNMIELVNQINDAEFNKCSISFFGEGLTSMNFFVDLIIVFVVILVCLLIFFTIFWTIQDNKKLEKEEKNNDKKSN